MEDRFIAQREGIRFYVEKSFQASFAYFAALGAFLAFVLHFGPDTTARVQVIGCVAILFLNVFYFSVVCSCLFAILKNSLFILASTQPSPERDWEIYARGAANLYPKLTVNRAEWTIDTGFIYVIALLIFGVSIAASWFGFAAGPFYVRLFVAVGATAHLVPCWMLLGVTKLEKQCRNIISQVSPATAPTS